MQDEHYNNGVLIDERPPEVKENDHHFAEVVATAAPVDWQEKPRSQWRKFPISDQNGSGSCVAQTIVKLLGIMYWLIYGKYVEFSATHVYQRRKNKGSPGMSGMDAFDIAQQGVTLEILAPSQAMTDAEMDAEKIEDFKQKVGELFKIGTPIVDPVKDIETIASIIQQTGKGVMCWYSWKSDEYCRDTPVVLYPGLKINEANNHSVAIVDYTLVNGKKCLIMDESWGKKSTIDGQRIITEDFHKERNWFSAHAMSFKFAEGTGIRPHYNGSIISLQQCLRYDGVFPANIDFVENIGPATRQAISKFQVKYGLDTLGTGKVGPKTEAKLREMFP